MLRFVLTVFLLLITLLPAQAGTLPMEQFRQIPVLHEGRIKPIDTFARVSLEALSGSDHLQNMTAAEWLAETLFDPISSAERPLFKIKNANTRHRLSLPDRPDPMFSYMELAPSLEKTRSDIEPLYKKSPGALNTDEKDLLEIHDRAYMYTQILRTLSLILPLNIDIPPPWNKTFTGTVSYLDLRKSQRDVEVAAANIVKRKGANPESYTENEKNTALLGYQLRLMGDAASTNDLVRIIPVPWSGAAGEWQSPWAVLQQGSGSPETGALLQVWRNLAISWQQEQSDEWGVATQQAASLPLAMSHQENDRWRIKLELAYNQSNPQFISLLFYSLSLAFALGFFISASKSFRFLSLSALGIGACIHLTGVVTRIILLGRPPVSTLYESLIFVALVCVVIGIAIEIRLKNGAGIFTASVSGLFIGLMASSFGADSDTLKLLSAVLNTQFWLATHVLCITFGYGWCVVTAMLAHLNLANRAFSLAPQGKIEALSRMTSMMSMIALLFTTIGTILGGIWADQSWGRFWGWDPKENGALLIVLWLTWLQHGKLSRHLNDTALLAGQAFLTVIVGAAWLGVNLLGVGLHSYGFTDGLFWGLGLFTILEMIYIGTMWYLIRKKEIAA